MPKIPFFKQKNRKRRFSPPLFLQAVLFGRRSVIVYAIRIVIARQAVLPSIIRRRIHRRAPCCILRSRVAVAAEGDALERAVAVLRGRTAIVAARVAVSATATTVTAMIVAMVLLTATRIEAVASKNIPTSVAA